jgi:hypothetical protein
LAVQGACLSDVQRLDLGHRLLEHLLHASLDLKWHLDFPRVDRSAVRPAKVRARGAAVA